MNNEVKFIERGWECPKCGAVMAPHINVCVNCKGTNGGTTISASELHDCVQRYYNGNDCYESVTPIICNGRADVMPTEVNTEEAGVTSTFVYDGEVKEVYLK